MLAKCWFSLLVATTFDQDTYMKIQESEKFVYLNRATKKDDISLAPTKSKHNEDSTFNLSPLQTTCNDISDTRFKISNAQPDWSLSGLP